MRTYDFRFDTKLIQSFVGLPMISYNCTDSMVEMVNIQIGDNAYCLTNEYEEYDFFSLENENTVYRLSKFYGSSFDSIQIMESVNQVTSMVVLLNEHITLEKNESLSYDMWNTKAIIFVLDDYELCFMRKDYWLSEKIEILKGKDLLNQIRYDQSIFDDFIDMKDGIVEVKREIVTFR